MRILLCSLLCAAALPAMTGIVQAQGYYDRADAKINGGNYRPYTARSYSRGAISHGRTVVLTARRRRPEDSAGSGPDAETLARGEGQRSASCEGREGGPASPRGGHFGGRSASSCAHHATHG